LIYIQVTGDGSGSKILSQVRWGYFFVAWVGSGKPPLGLEISPKSQIFLLRVEKISSGTVIKKYLHHSWVCPLFTADQKNVRVGSEPISTLNTYCHKVNLMFYGQWYLYLVKMKVILTFNSLWGRFRNLYFWENYDLKWKGNLKSSK